MLESLERELKITKSFPDGIVPPQAHFLPPNISHNPAPQRVIQIDHDEFLCLACQRLHRRLDFRGRLLEQVHAVRRLGHVPEPRTVGFFSVHRHPTRGIQHNHSRILPQVFHQSQVHPHQSERQPATRVHVEKAKPALKRSRNPGRDEDVFHLFGDLPYRRAKLIHLSQQSVRSCVLARQKFSVFHANGFRRDPNHRPAHAFTPHLFRGLQQGLYYLSIWSRNCAQLWQFFSLAEQGTEVAQIETGNQYKLQRRAGTWCLSLHALPILWRNPAQPNLPPVGVFVARTPAKRDASTSAH